MMMCGVQTLQAGFADLKRHLRPLPSNILFFISALDDFVQLK